VDVLQGLTGTLKTAQSPHAFIVLDGPARDEELKRPTGGGLRQLPDERPIQAMAEIDNEHARKTISQWFRRMIGMSYRNDGNINRLEPLIDENINRLEHFQAKWIPVRVKNMR
jgi:hypothetical protein